MDEREQFVRGTLTGALLMSAAAVAGLLVWGRASWALAFGIGAGVSLGNFWLVATAVIRLTSTGGPGWAGLWRGSLARFGIVGLVLVLALVVVKVSLVPLVAGLLLTQVWMVGHWLWSSIRALT
jgi:hypothetical protein